MNSARSVKQLIRTWISEKSPPVGSPDSKSLLFYGSDHKLRMVTGDTMDTKVVAQNDTGDLDSAEFSPDGKWISYSKEDKLLRSHVFVKELDGGPERMITSPEFLVSTGAKWTADGKKLLVLGGTGRGRDGGFRRHILATLRGSVSTHRQESG